MKPTSKGQKALFSRLLLSAALVLSVRLAAGNEWTIDTVDQSGPGYFASMKIDQKGNVHIAYIPEEDGHPLKYAFWDHTVNRWFTMTVSGGASFCTLTLDSTQRPHISYADHGTGKGAKLRHVYWTGTEWHQQPVSPNTDGVVAYYTSIALDAHDNPAFSYYDYGGPGEVGFLLRLRSVFWNGKYWEVHMVDRQPGSGKFNSMAMDSAGHPHVAYANVKAEFSSLRYASWDGESWKTEVLDGIDGPKTIWSVALVLDKNDKPHISYTDVEHRLVKYATKENGKWQLEVVDSIGKEGYPDRNGIAVDEQGNPYMSYYDAGNGLLKLAVRRAGKWYGELLARDYAGFTSSLQIHDGVLWVAFADDGGGSLKVGRRKLEEPISSAAAAPSAVAKTSSR